MNKRILELAEQAGYNPAWSTKADREEYLDIEKFAELIVKECMTVCENFAERNDPTVSCYYDIKEHFGVT